MTDSEEIKPHSITLCRFCGTVMLGCRCPGLHTIVQSSCPSCTNDSSSLVHLSDTELRDRNPKYNFLVEEPSQDDKDQLRQALAMENEGLRERLAEAEASSRKWNSLLNACGDAISMRAGDSQECIPGKVKDYIARIEAKRDNTKASADRLGNALNECRVAVGGGPPTPGSGSDWIADQVKARIGFLEEKLEKAEGESGKFQALLTECALASGMKAGENRMDAPDHIGQMVTGRDIAKQYVKELSNLLLECGSAAGVCPLPPGSGHSHIPGGVRDRIAYLKEKLEKAAVLLAEDAEEKADRESEISALETRIANLQQKLGAAVEGYEET